MHQLLYTSTRQSIRFRGAERFQKTLRGETGIRRQGGDPVPGNDRIRAETIRTPVAALRTDAAQGGAFRLNHPDFLFTDLAGTAHELIPPINGRHYNKETLFLQEEAPRNTGVGLFHGGVHQKFRELLSSLLGLTF